MAMTKIEWTEQTWNPITGCSKISEGCKNCYAERMAKRLQAMGSSKYANGFKVTCHPETLSDPFHLRRSRMIFVNSMSDLFHDDVPDEFIFQCFRTMAHNPRHKFQILTKRPERMTEIMPHILFQIRTRLALPEKLKNVWLGVSVENQQRANERIPLLLNTAATVRFISCEPLLGPISLPEVNEVIGSKGINYSYSTGIDWLIAGCESGPQRRPADINWFRFLQFQCEGASIPFFLKQMEVNGKLAKMPKLDGVVWDQYPKS
jgi:protein gp37